MLYYGVPGLTYVFTRDNGRDFGGDLFEIILFLLIGTICLYFAVRWCKAAIHMIAGT